MKIENTTHTQIHSTNSIRIRLEQSYNRVKNTLK